MSKQYCERYEQTPIQLDTALISVLIIIIIDNVKQQKSGYRFTINDRSSYFDWLTVILF